MQVGVSVTHHSQEAPNYDSFQMSYESTDPFGQIMHHRGWLDQCWLDKGMGDLSGFHDAMFIFHLDFSFKADLPMTCWSCVHQNASFNVSGTAFLLVSNGTCSHFDTQTFMHNRFNLAVNYMLQCEHPGRTVLVKFPAPYQLLEDILIG